MTIEKFLKEWNNESDKVLVHTSGSTGAPKPMWAEKCRMMNSARITCDFLGLHDGDTALLCMSLDYIAGKMMVVRAQERGLKLTTVEPCGNPFGKLLDAKDNISNEELNNKRIAQSNLEVVNGEIPDGGFDLVAMVPMQVYNTLRVPEEREMLMRTRHLIIGGGAIDDEMEAELRSFPNAVWSTYGMTETLSHIALRRINGADASLYYEPFKSVDVSLNADGCLVINAPLVCDKPLTTNDIAEIISSDSDTPDSAGNTGSSGCRFRILGRKDNVICSGGIKIQAEEVERLLKPYIRVPYIITKKRDSKFGEIVVLVVQSADAEGIPVDMETILSACHRVLPKFSQPREYLFIDSIPMTETGKLKRNFLF